MSAGGVTCKCGEPALCSAGKKGKYRGKNVYTCPHFKDANCGFFAAFPQKKGAELPEPAPIVLQAEEPPTPEEVLGLSQKRPREEDEETPERMEHVKRLFLAAQESHMETQRLLWGLQQAINRL